MVVGDVSEGGPDDGDGIDADVPVEALVFGGDEGVFDGLGNRVFGDHDAVLFVDALDFRFVSVVDDGGLRHLGNVLQVEEEGPEKIVGDDGDEGRAKEGCGGEQEAGIMGWPRLRVISEGVNRRGCRRGSILLRRGP